MKRFEFPEIKVEMFISEDILTTSAVMTGTNADHVRSQMSSGTYTGLYVME